MDANLKKFTNIFESSLQKSTHDLDPEDHAADIAQDFHNLRSGLAKVYGSYGEKAGTVISNYVHQNLVGEGSRGIDAEHIAQLIRDNA